MKKVSAEEIQRLYQFTQQHYVEYYDVQTELVDHLANAIEEKWEENPELDFEQSLQQEFKKFGVFGFMNVVEERQKAMQKRYINLLWGEAKEFLKMPKVLLTILSLFVLIELLSTSQFGGIFFTSVLVFSFTGFAGVSFYQRFQHKKAQKKKGYKKYLLEEILNDGNNLLIVVLVPQLLVNITDLWDINYSENFLYSSLFAIFFVLSSVYFYITYFILPQKKEKILQKVYPERQFM